MIGALVLNGDKYNGIIEGDYVVCCDGGYNKSPRCDYFVGDMDSVDGEVTAKIHKLECAKNMTDGEVGIDYLISLGVDGIIIYGLDGGRFDHQLLNIALMARAVRANAPCEARCNNFTAYMVKDRFYANIPSGIILSMVPFAGDTHIISTKGLAYPLKDYAMSKFDTRTVSNVTLGGEVEIVLSGFVLIIVNAK